MSFFKQRRRPRSNSAGRRREPSGEATPEGLSGTGAEATYLRSLVDSRAVVTVVLAGGQRLRGQIRYLDRDCFSLGQAERGPNIFLRKSGVRYICEE